MSRPGDADRMELTHQALELLVLSWHSQTRLVQVLSEMRGGYGSSAEGRITSRSMTSPVEAQAGAKDPARQAQDRYDRALRKLHEAASEMASITQHWTRKPERSGAAEGELGCEIVGREKLWRDGEWHEAWEPVWRTSDVGVLARPYRLGRWAYDFVVRAARLPTKTETQAHLDGKLVRAL